ncbi:L,D-transpeptidase family protein [Desulfosarcina ovata]|uniref:Peptidoglycan-binding protein n=1 Tax=Desulfosarcina ovata subsp. ovata TaxID=2752305 RepID=A0A5K8AC14_9BACT|nr:L,D-transpeptidase family protein [Desulfosarcina ovata]BBO89988.1 peptidoglycan-binding protein [Desulfosarcina ovata subsp. ovata]
MGNARLNRWSCCLVSLLLLAPLMFGSGRCAAETNDAPTPIPEIQAAILSRLENHGDGDTVGCQGEILCGTQLLPTAYDKRDDLPLWVDDGCSVERATHLFDLIGKATEDGLNPADYHHHAIQHLLAAICERRTTGIAVPPAWWADLDLILTDAFLLYGSHLSTGRVNPETLGTDWKIHPGSVDLMAVLDSATAPDGNIETAMDALRPPYDGYHSLRRALARLRVLAPANGWSTVAGDKTLRPGDRAAAVTALRHRLTESGELNPARPVTDTAFFDSQLAAAVKRFQRRHGLEPDGIVGRKTVGMLNVSVEQRIRQVALNLERWRWRPRDLGNRYVMINTADFRLDAVEDGQVVVTMRVVVGRPARRSPVFSARISYLVVNPYWNVPTTIAVEDILPELRKDISYLSRHNIRVFENWQSGAREVDPATVDWRAYHANRFPFRLRQDPGTHNALGRIKFMFPNPFAIYLHDTPHRSLFRRAQRDFSSGCIRVEAPMALAHFVLAENPTWTDDKLTELIDSGETRTIRLRHPVPVHLVYMTAWTDETGSLQFRSDIYQRDRDLQKAFDRHHPKRSPGLAFMPDTPDGRTRDWKNKFDGN